MIHLQKFNSRKEFNRLREKLELPKHIVKIPAKVKFPILLSWRFDPERGEYGIEWNFYSMAGDLEDFYMKMRNEEANFNEVLDDSQI